MSGYRLHHRAVTVSTNLDARAGAPGDVFVADFQTAGRGRLDHRWHAAPGRNLMFSAVLSAEGLSPAAVSTLPLVVGLAVVRTVAALVPGADVKLKWPNDVLVGGKKICGILCERHGDNVIAGVGLNVNETERPSDIAARSTSLALLAGAEQDREIVLQRVLEALAACEADWRKGGLAAFRAELDAHDFLKGRSVEILQTDGDENPVCGLCGGIADDGALRVGDTAVYAGEAHVRRSFPPCSAAVETTATTGFEGAS